MTDSFSDHLAALRSWTPEEPPLPVLEGALDPHRSDEAHLLFAVDPCRGPWIRIPTGAVAGVRRMGEVRCGAAAFPGVALELDPADPAALTVVDAVRAGLGGPGGVARAGAGGAVASGVLGGGDGDAGAATHDVRVEVHPEGKLYRIRLHLEGEEVTRVDWDSERKLYVGRIQGLPVEDSLDVAVQAWGAEGSKLTVAVEVDGRPLRPELEVTVTEGPAEGRRAYRI